MALEVWSEIRFCNNVQFDKDIIMNGNITMKSGVTGNLIFASGTNAILAQDFPVKIPRSGKYQTDININNLYKAYYGDTEEEIYYQGFVFYNNGEYINRQLVNSTENWTETKSTRTIISGDKITFENWIDGKHYVNNELTKITTPLTKFYIGSRVINYGTHAVGAAGYCREELYMSIDYDDPFFTCEHTTPADDDGTSFFTITKPTFNKLYLKTYKEGNIEIGKAIQDLADKIGSGSFFESASYNNFGGGQQNITGNFNTYNTGNLLVTVFQVQGDPAALEVGTTADFAYNSSQLTNGFKMNLPTYTEASTIKGFCLKKNSKENNIYYEMTATITKSNGTIYLHIEVNNRNEITLSDNSGMVWTAITWCDESKKS